MSIHLVLKILSRLFGNNIRLPLQPIKMLLLPSTIQSHILIDAMIKENSLLNMLVNIILTLFADYCRMTFDLKEEINNMINNKGVAGIKRIM